MAKSARSSVTKTIFTLVVLAALAAAGFKYWKGRGDQAPEFNTTTVALGDVTQTVTASGDLQAVTTVDVSSQVSGLIVEVNADFNTPVKAGQVLAQIDPATYEQRLLQAEADLAATRASNALVRINTERIRELFEKNLVSKQELDSAEAQFAQSNAQLLTREAAVEDARVNLARCTIYSPIDGIVLTRATDVGRTVAASLNAPTLFTIVDDLARMRISAAVAEADIGNVTEGQTATFTVDAFPGRQFRGRVVQVRNAPKTNQNVVTYETIIEVANDDLKLKPGMTANVSIVVAHRAGVLRVANSALRARIPDEVKVPAPPQAEAAPQTEAKAMTDEERHAARQEIFQIMREGSGSPEAVQKAQARAKELGVEFDPARFASRAGRRGDGGGEGGGKGRSVGERGSFGAGVNVSSQPRTVYKLAGRPGETQRALPAIVRLGISDGIYTEVIEGLSENDTLITSVIVQGSSPLLGAQQQQTRNPFQSGGRRPF